jgi:transcriptional regulator GlxA family with amidase domain
MKIAILLFERLTALDAIGPYEVLSRLPGAEVVFTGLARGEVRTANQALRLGVDRTLDEVPAADVLVIPGGYGERALEREPRVLEWIRAVDAGTRITASVCTGALLLGAAGLLRGKRATTHWARLSRLAEFGAIPVSERVVRDGKIATAAGVSAGIDLGLSLAIELAGPAVAEVIQLSIEYDPAPPLDAGSPKRASAAARDAVLARVDSQDRA